MDAGTCALRCTAVPGGVELAVRVAPGSARAGVRGPYGEQLKVAVRSPPEKGKANHELEEVLAAFFGVPARQARVVAGHTSRSKRVRLYGLDANALRARLNRMG
jgi:hypothetical protein